MVPSISTCVNRSLIPYSNNILCGRKTQVVCEGEYFETSSLEVTTAYDMLTSEQANCAKFISLMSDVYKWVKRGRKEDRDYSAGIRW